MRLTYNLVSLVRWQIQEFSIPEPSEADKRVNKESHLDILRLTWQWAWAVHLEGSSPGWCSPRCWRWSRSAPQETRVANLKIRRFLDNIWHFISLSVLNWFYFQFLQLFNSEENWELNLNFAKVMILCDLQKDLNFLTDSISQDIPKSL